MRCFTHEVCSFSIASCCFFWSISCGCAVVGLYFENYSHSRNKGNNRKNLNTQESVSDDVSSLDNVYLQVDGSSNSVSDSQKEGAPVAIFENQMSGIGDASGIIAIDYNNAHFASNNVTNIDYPYIIWDPVPGATTYEIYRKLENKGDYTQLATTAGTRSSIITPEESNTRSRYFQKLKEKIKGKYSYGDISLSKLGAAYYKKYNKRDGYDENKDKGKYYYKVIARDSAGKSLDSQPILMSIPLTNPHFLQ